jgi:type IV pilus assembly protein PilM
MEKNPVAWGLDIGHSSIKAVKLARIGKDVTVLGYAIEPITQGEGTDRDEAVVKALEALSTREEFGTAPVVAALSGRQIFSRTINIPIINAKKVDRMVELEARQQIPGNFDDIEWSYHLSPAADGTSNDVAIFAARKELIGELVAKSKKVGLNLVAVSVSSLALYNFIRYDQEFPLDETVIILDVGAENTDLVLYQGDTLWMRTLAVSGNDITKAFMKKFRVSFEEAETLKRQIGESRQADKIFKVIESSMNELNSEVTRSLGFYKQSNPGAKLESLVISGNTFKLPNLPQYLADRLRFAVIMLEDLDRIKLADGMDRAHFLTDLQSLGVAMGLALQGTGVAKAQVNLMPTEARIERLLKTKRWAAVALLGMILLTIVVHNVVFDAVASENAALVKDIRAAYKDNDAKETEAREALKRIEPVARKLSTFDSYGRHKGVNHAVIDGVVHALSEAIAGYGPVKWQVPPELKGEDGPSLMQRIYIGRIEVPPFEFGADPFRPLAEERRVVVEVHIVREDRDETLQISKELEDRLKAIPVPAGLKGLHGGEALFADVQNRGSRAAENSFWYKNDRYTDAKGDVRPFEKEVRYKVAIATFDCTLAAAGASSLAPAANKEAAP